jgi:hypothetical protein
MGTRDKRGPGRPPKPRDQVRKNRVVILLTDDELDVIEELAAEQASTRGSVAYAFVARGLRRYRARR